MYNNVNMHVCAAAVCILLSWKIIIIVYSALSYNKKSAADYVY